MEHQEDHMDFPCVSAPSPAIVEDCGRVRNLTESSLLRKDVVSFVVPKLSFFGSLRKVIGETAYPLPLGSVEGVGVILLVLSIWTVVFAGHCAVLLQ
jgi:hypothetical protein